MKPRCPRSEASAGTPVEEQLAIVLLSNLLRELPGVSRRPDRAGWLGKVAAGTLPSATPWDVRKCWGQGPHAQLIRILSPPPPGTSGQLPDITCPQVRGA